MRTLFLIYTKSFIAATITRPVCDESDTFICEDICLYSQSLAQAASDHAGSLLRTATAAVGNRIRIPGREVLAILEIEESTIET